MSEMYRLVYGDEIKVAEATAKKDFLEQLSNYGLTVLPEYQTKWWKYV